MEIKEKDKTEVLKGGEFLVKETNANDVFIREEFGEEQMMMLNATEEFSKIEIIPNLMRFEEKIALISTIFILGGTTIGVTKILLERKKIQCACLGTTLKLPMTEATLIENVIMILMAAIMLVK